jgi:WD40 repeat protein
MGTCGSKADVKTVQSSPSFNENSEKTQSLSSFLASENYKNTHSLLSDPSLPLSSKLSHLQTSYSFYLRRHSKEVTSISTSPDDSFIVTSSKDCSIRFWSPSKRKQIGEILHSKEVNQVVLLKNNTKLISLSSNSEIAIWSLPSRLLHSKFDNFPYQIGSIQVSDNGKELFIGGGYLPQQDTCPIRVLNIETGEELRTYEGHRAAANHIAFTNDYKFFASCSGGQYTTVTDNSVLFWDVKKVQPINSYSEFNSFVNTVCISNSLKQVITGCKDCTIYVFTFSLQKVHIFRGHTSSVNCLALSKAEDFLYSGSSDSTLKVWDLKNKWMFTEQKLSTIYSLAVQNSTILAGCMCSVKMFDQGLKLESGLPGHHGEIQLLKINPNSHYFLTGSIGKVGNDKTIQIWNLFTGDQEKVINQLPAFTDLELNSDGTGVLFTLEDGYYAAYSVRGEKKWVKRSTRLDFLLMANRGLKLR